MPTGYTYNIVEGKTKTFKEFATDCIRAFLYYMRDEPGDKPFYPIEPSGYHLKEIKKYKKQLSDAAKLSDAEIIVNRKNKLEQDKKYHEDAIIKCNKAREMLTAFYKEAKEYQPPTPKHEGIKTFMVEQLRITLEADGDPKYHIDALKVIEKKLQNIEAKTERERLISKAEKEIKYHSKENTEEIKRCEEQNKWSEDFFNSLRKR